MIRRDQRLARAGNLDARDFDMPFVINVVEMQERQDAGVGAFAPQVHAQIDRLQLLAQRRGGDAAAPFVEIAEHDLRRVNPPVVHDRGKALGLVAPLAKRGAEVHVEKMQRALLDHQIHPLAAPWLARLPGQVVLIVLLDRKLRQHDVAELMAAQVADRRHHPAHAKAGAYLLGLALSVGAGADDLLERDDVGVQSAEDVDGALGKGAPVQPATPVDVVGDDADGFTYHALVPEKPVPKLQSEREMTCPCCGATLIVDMNLGRVVSHREVGSGLNIELSDAQKILSEEKHRREAAFDQSVNNERTRGDALSRRFEEALKQAKDEPITKPTRDFDLD